MRVTFLGQAGLLFETENQTIMIDPYLSDSIRKINPKNYRRVPVDEKFFDVKPDVMIFTHSHLDHYDPETVKHFITPDTRMTVLAPMSVWAEVKKIGGTNNYVLFNRHTEWTQENVCFRAVKADHSDESAIGVLISVEIKDHLKTVKDKSPVAISAGERLYTRWDYRKMFDLMAADYIQPDISHAGGIMELKKIAAEAECRYIPFAPHNPSGPVANAATLQLAATCPNFEILEIMYSDVDWRKDVTNESLEYKEGYMAIPNKPGLGIEIDEEACLEHPYQVHTLRHYTGALTDIRPAKTEFYF